MCIYVYTYIYIYIYIYIALTLRTRDLWTTARSAIRACLLSRYAVAFRESWRQHVSVPHRKRGWKRMRLAKTELRYSYPYPCPRKFYKLPAVLFCYTNLFYEPCWAWAWGWISQLHRDMFGGS